MSNPTKKCAKDMNKQYNRKQNANTNRTQINIDGSICGFRELLFPMRLEIGLKISYWNPIFSKTDRMKQEGNVRKNTISCCLYRNPITLHCNRTNHTV